MPSIKRKYSAPARPGKRNFRAGSTNAKIAAIKRARAGAPLGYRKVGYPAIRKAGEVKYVDLASANYGLNTTGSVTLLPIIPQGPDEINRIGRNVALRSLYIRGRCTNNSTATLNQCVIAIVYDRQSNKANPAITDVYTSISPNAFRNDENKDRFLILKEWRFNLAGVSTATLNADHRNINKYMKLPNLPVNYSTGTTGLIGEINTGGLYLMTFGNTVSGTADATFAATFRTRFVDV